MMNFLGDVVSFGICEANLTNDT